MTRIRFTVTQAHIDAGREFPTDPDQCPIARALLDATGAYWSVAEEDAWRWTGHPYASPETVFVMPRSGARFQRRLSRGKAVGPFTGEVYQ